MNGTLYNSCIIELNEQVFCLLTRPTRFWRESVVGLATGWCCCWCDMLANDEVGAWWGVDMLLRKRLYVNTTSRSQNARKEVDHTRHDILQTFRHPSSYQLFNFFLNIRLIILYYSYNVNMIFLNAIAKTGKLPQTTWKRINKSGQEMFMYHRSQFRK